MKEGGELAWAAGGTARAATAAAAAVAAEARRMRWVDDMSQVLPSISSPADSRADRSPGWRSPLAGAPHGRTPCYGNKGHSSHRRIGTRPPPCPGKTGTGRIG